jgi:hypothetical protein
MGDFVVTDFGAAGDGTTADTAAIQRAIDACHAQGGGRVVLPAGRTFLSGSIALRARVELHVEPGATLLASGNGDDYTIPITSANRRPFISADGADDIAVTGAGVIDGNGRAFVQERLPHIYVMKRRRPKTFLFLGCRRVTFRDVTIRDGASWTVRLSGCEDVVIHGVRIYNDLKLPNSDAIDLDRCRNVRISDCHIESGDDCICLKALAETDGHGPCENVTVTGCTLVSTSAALIIGCECRAPIRNVVFDACVITRSHRGLAVHLSEGCDVENVTFSNMIVETRLFHSKWWGRAEPIYVTAIPWTAETPIGRVQNVRFVNVLCRSENGVFIQGWEPSRVDGILLENVRVELDRWTKLPGGEHDIRPYPQDPGGPGAVGVGVYAHPTAGFYLKNARDVTLRHCEVVWQSSPEYFRHAVESHNVEQLVLDDVRGDAAHQQFPAIVQD